MHICTHLYVKYCLRPLRCCVFYVTFNFFFLLLNGLNLQVDSNRLLDKKLICSEYFLDNLFLGRNVITPRSEVESGIVLKKQ